MFNSQQTTLKVALYIRVSTEEQVERYGIDLQVETLKNLIKGRPKLEDGKDSMVLAGDQYIYIDKGVPGTTPLDERPAFSKLKEDIVMCQNGEPPFDVVLVYKIDRFARKLSILLEIIDFLSENDVKFISAHESIDTSTAFGRAILGIIGVIAELEIETTKDRTTAGRRQAFNQGTVLGANAPYGYAKNIHKKYTISKKESEVVKLIFDMFLKEDRSFEYIANYLTSMNVPSPEASSVMNGKKKGEIKKKTHINLWRANRIGYIIRNDIYTGKIYSNKTKKGKSLPKAEWELSSTLAPVIIDEIIFEKAQAKLDSGGYIRKVAKDNHTYLLSGLLKCNCCYNQKDPEYTRVNWCGHRKSVGKGYQYYYECTRKNKSKTTNVCGALPLNALEIEDYLVNYCKDLLKNPVAVFNHQLDLQSRENTINSLQKKEQSLIDLINAIPARRDMFKEQHIERIIRLPELTKSLDSLEADRKRYESELGEIRNQISSNSLSKNYIDVLALFSDKYKPMLEKNFSNRESVYKILHMLIDEVIIKTRPLTKDDVVAGKRKENQQIPNNIHIRLRLPQDIFKNLQQGSIQESVSGAR